MGILGLLLVLIGGAVGITGGLWLLVLAFQESILWGLGTIFVPFVGLVFAIMFWDKTKTAFLLNLGGFVLMCLGAILGGVGAEPMPTGPAGF